MPVKKRWLKKSQGKPTGQHTEICHFATLTLNFCLEHLVPFALIFEHDFAKKPNGRHTVIEQLVVEFLQ
jgi:hypothetical protein